MQPTALQGWAEANDPSNSDLLFKNGFWDQIRFVRDTLTGIVYKVYGSDFDIASGVRASLMAISTHTSKSVHLPVFHMTLPDGTECVMRYNFHDWKVSIKASQPVTSDFSGLFNSRAAIDACYCEGFPRDWVLGSFANDQQKFTVELMSQYEVFTFFWLLISNLAAQQQAAAV